MGSIFRLNVIESSNILETIKEIKKRKFKIYGTTLNSDKTIYDIQYKKAAIVIGSEAHGISKEVLKEVSQEIKIPMIRKS